MNDTPGIILVGTQLAENLGAVCRSMRCFGLSRLSLVRPLCEPHDPMCVAMATGAESIAHGAVLYDSMAEAAASFRVVIGMTRRAGRMRQLDGELCEVYQRVALLCGLGAVSLADVAFAFGPEATGLSNEDVQLCDLLASIPTDPAYGSLNLAHAVTCVGYEWIRQRTVTQEALVDANESATDLSASRDRVHNALMAYLDGLAFHRSEPREVTALRAAQILRRSLLTQRDLLLLEKSLRKLARLSSSGSSEVR